MLTAEEEAVLARLRDDFPFYAKNVLRIAHAQNIVPFELRPPQQRLWDVLAAQRDAGKPMRAVILKSRKLGFSTAVQGMIFQRATLKPNHAALTVAQKSDTAEEIVRMAELMYDNVPEELAPYVRPVITNRRKHKEMHFGRINSRMLIDTAREFEGGRGHTFHSLHLSEVGTWPDLRRKLLSLINAVPRDDPDTLIVLESTANGPNEFRQFWRNAEDGKNDYFPFFAGWQEDPSCVMPLSDEQRGEIEATLGAGTGGEDEPALFHELGLSLEQIAWRRWAIDNLAGGDLGDFQQEYPSSAAEAFKQSGRNVFSPVLVTKAIEAAQEHEDFEDVLLTTTRTTTRKRKFSVVDVPTQFSERPVGNSRTDLFWRVWERPEEKGQYVVVVDPALGEEKTSGESDWTAVQIINHKTLEQCAEMQTRADADLVAEQVYLALLMYSVRPNLPMLVVEMTGGYGNLILERLNKEYGWGRVYRRRPVDPRRRDRDSKDVLGFSTDRSTKPRLVDGMRELLREGTHGIRSLRLAHELETYTRTKTGKTEAAAGEFDDLLTCYMVGQYVIQERPPRPDRSPGAVVDMATRAIRNPRTGY
jgi:hypothetical protein